MPSYTLDVIVIGVILLSAVLALFRGFTREFLSIVAWGVAIIAGIKFFPLVSQELAPHISYLKDKDGVRNAVAGVLVFIVVLVIISIISVKISDAIQDSKGGALDRSLGFAFGIARGLLLCGIAFLIYSETMNNVPNTQQPDWVVNARLRPLLGATASEIKNFLPTDFAATIASFTNKGGAANGSEGAASQHDQTQQTGAPAAVSPAANPSNSQPAPNAQPAVNVSPPNSSSPIRTRRSDSPAAAQPAAPPPSNGPSGYLPSDKQRLDALTGGTSSGGQQPPQNNGSLPNRR